MRGAGGGADRLAARSPELAHTEKGGVGFGNIFI